MVSARRELPSYEEFPSPGKREWGEQPASPAFQNFAQRTHFSFTLPSKLRLINTARKKKRKKSKGYQYQPRGGRNRGSQ